MNLNSIGYSVIEQVKKTGEFIIEQRKSFSVKSIEHKGLHDLVSYVDKEAELQLVNALNEILPQAGFITEEQTAGHNHEEYLWIIDPLDGTTNYIHGVAPYAISIALQQNNKTILGVIYEMGAKEIFYSWNGIDAFCNGSKINVSIVENIDNALISTGFPINDFSRLTSHLTVVKKVVENSHGLRRHGSAATDLAFVAAGRIDGFFEYGLSVWDLAAGAYLVEKAGGVVSDYKGGENFYFGRELCAGTKNVHTQLLEILKTDM